MASRSKWQVLANQGIEANFGDDWVKIGGLKGFVDGSIGSTTAKMYAPFVNEPNSTGIYVTPLAEFFETLRARRGQRLIFPLPFMPSATDPTRSCWTSSKRLPKPMGLAIAAFGSSTFSTCARRTSPGSANRA